MKKGIVLIAIVPLLFGCAFPDTIYRDSSAPENKCSDKTSIKLTSDNDETDERMLQSTKCASQKHIVNDQVKRDRQLNYQLEFIQFSELGAPLIESRAAEILQSLAENKNNQNIIVVFVHGWRHDADIGDRDVKRFRTLLAYTASFLDQRCKSAHRYCGARLTGIYVGWPGRTLVECETGLWCTAIGTAMATPTFWGRKAASEVIAPALFTFLADLNELVRRRNDSRPDVLFVKDRLMIMGHSLGGNALATALEASFKFSASTHEPNTVLDSPLGDLVVLINPAAEAHKWTGIQEEMRRKLGIFGSTSTTADSHKAFPITQKPVYISITSACNWSGATGKDLKDPSDKQKIRDVECDTATGQIFPLAQNVVGKFDIESFTTIGHLNPTPERRTGTTHEIEINGSVGKDTEYFNALNENLSQCLIADGWLRKARERSINRRKPDDRCATGCNWDAGLTPPGSGETSALDMINTRLKNIGNNKEYGGINAQFRHNILRSSVGRAITVANDPFWNVRALDSAITEHNGYVSYPLWCAINQLVLDDIVASTHRNQ